MINLLIEPLNFHLKSLHQQIDLFFYFFFKRLKQVRELVEQSIQILSLPNLSIILPFLIDNALICFGPGMHVIITSENLINSSNELVAFPFLDLNCFKDLALNRNPINLFSLIYVDLMPLASPYFLNQ